ncbi:phosphotriesterase family protein [Rhodococcus sp. OK302]|uniref:phosphotriesterase family protein n=1 Tax=Rhodococcus sp. OK302 TaxID=1882769 RepID=UPI000B93E8C4|nr:phosphotriesterase [Rhodococcus sp. OK302]OYD67706.1 phosphotriesterase-related protein [Rhodococcus sp. OK302]
MSPLYTVRGPIDTAELGRTYMHEHVFVLSADTQQNYPEEWGDEDVRVADAISKLSALVAQGVRTIVDPTVVGLGRYIPRIQRIAEQVPGLNIIVATGLYTQDEVPYFFRHRGPGIGEGIPDPMVDLFVKDIEEGIADTGVHAGLLKCAIDQLGLTSGVERVMRAVAKAHHRTGVPIMVHTHPETRSGRHIQKILCEQEGVQPHRIVLSHSGDTDDVEHLTELAEAGFILGMDRFGINVETTFETRADTLIEMCRRGFADQMVLSHDAACYADWSEPSALAAFPQWNYLHLANDVLPYVRKRGVTEEQITAMLVDTPRRYFEGVARS